MDRDSITQTGARAPGVERNTARTEVPARPIVPDTEQGNPDGGRKHEGRWQTRTRGRPHLIFRPLSRTGENPPYGILGEAMETSASFEARSAPLSYPTAKERPYGSVRGAAGNRCPYRDNHSLHYVDENKGVNQKAVTSDEWRVTRDRVRNPKRFLMSRWPDGQMTRSQER